MGSNASLKFSFFKKKENFLRKKGYDFLSKSAIFDKKWSINYGHEG